MPSELAVNYIGLELSSPVIVGACPLNIEPETVRQLVDAGAGAIVLPSIFQEQLAYRQLKASDPFGALAESGYQPQQDKYNGGVETYLRSITSLTQSCGVPVIASLNGASPGDWVGYAKEIEAAGADGLELNLQSTVFDPATTSVAIESQLSEIISNVAARIQIPIAVKVTQRYTNLASTAYQFQQAGAQGIVLFTHLPHWDICTDRMHRTIRWELTPVDALGGILEGITRIYNSNLELSVAASGGVASSEDAVKAMIAGADVVMVTSAVYREGPDAIRNMVDGIKRYLEMNHHRTIRDFQATRPGPEPPPEQTTRLEYTDPLTRSTSYVDPTPLPSHGTGDAYGHKN